MAGRFMKNLVEVCEFDYITCNEDYKDDDYYRYIGELEFNEFEELVIGSSLEEAASFFRLTSKRNVGKVIQVRNYVGLIQLKSGFKIQILPKIAYCNEDDVQRIFLKMVKSLKDFPYKTGSTSHLNTDNMNIFEIFIVMFISEVDSIVKRGIRSAYVTNEDNLSYFKGKLNFNDHIKRNIIHKERFSIIYDEFSVDSPENRLIKATLLKLFKSSESINNRKRIQQLLINFENVSASYDHKKDFSKVIINRSNKYYEMVMSWCRIFLLNQSFTTFSGTEKSQSLLFPMEKLFESYTASMLRKYIYSNGSTSEMSVQDRNYYLFDEPRTFSLRPDIVITREDKTTVVLDTKWKVLINNPYKNYGISQMDMYQMYAYSKKYNTSEICLLYPINDEFKNKPDISFKSDDNVTVRIFFVDLNLMDSSIGELAKILNI